MKPSMIVMLQLVASCLLVALLPSPGEAMHRGPMLKIRFGHSGGGGSNAAAVLAAGIVVKLLHELKKHHHKGFSVSGYTLERSGSGHGHSMSGGYGRSMGGGYGHIMEEGHGMNMINQGYGMSAGTEWFPMIAGNGMGHSFGSHDDHLSDYGYEPQAMPWTK